MVFQKSLRPCALDESSLRTGRVDMTHAGYALMTEWSKALLLTARCLSPLTARVRIPAGLRQKVAGDFT